MGTAIVALLGGLLYGVFGLSIGILSIPASLCAVLCRLMPHRRGFRLFAVFVSGLVFLLLFVDMNGRAGPRTRVLTDKNNIRGLLLNLELWKAETGSYPCDLRALVEGLHLGKHATAPSGGFGGLDPVFEGPLVAIVKRDRIFTLPHLVGDGAGIRFGEEYLWLPPSKDEKELRKVVIMTPPNTLYENQVNVGYLDGTVTTLQFDEWKNDPEIVQLIREYVRRRSSPE